MRIVSLAECDFATTSAAVALAAMAHTPTPKRWYRGAARLVGDHRAGAWSSRFGWCAAYTSRADRPGSRKLLAKPSQLRCDVDRIDLDEFVVLLVPKRKEKARGPRGSPTQPTEPTI